jgi:hypothetical protein
MPEPDFRAALQQLADAIDGSEIRFPKYDWHGQEGTWFPEPTHWHPLPSPPTTPNPHA